MSKAIPIIIALVVTLTGLAFLAEEMFEKPMRIHETNNGFVDDNNSMILCTKPFEMNHYWYCDIDNIVEVEHGRE